MARGTFLNMIQAVRVGTLAQDGRHDLLVHAAGCAANRQLRSASAPWLQRVAVPQQHGMYRRAFGTSGPTSPPTKHEADPRSVPKRSEAFRSFRPAGLEDLHQRHAGRAVEQREI